MMNRIIENIVHQEIKNMLNENLTDVLFHFTSLNLGYKIMKSNAYYLPSVYSGFGSVETFNKKKYYMCFTRNKSNLIGYAMGNNVRFEFNGYKLNQEFTGKAVNYWGANLGGPHRYMSQTPISYTQHDNETEDRLFSNKPVIKNIKKYINRVDILIDKNDKYNCYIAKKMLIDTSFKDILFIYDNQKDFNSRNKNIINDYIINYNIENQEGYEYQDMYNKRNERYIFGNLYEIFRNFCTYDLNYQIIIKNPTEFFINLLKKFSLDNYVPYMENGFSSYNDRIITYNYDLIKTIHKNIRNMEEYSKIMKLVEYLYKFFNVNNITFTIKNSEHCSKIDNFYEFQKEHPKKFNAIINEKEHICVLHPETTKCKDVNFLNSIIEFKEDYINDIIKNMNSYRNNDYEKFYNYLHRYINEDMTVSSLLKLYNNLDMNNKKEVFTFIPYFKEFVIDYNNYYEVERFVMSKYEKKEFLETFDKNYFYELRFKKLKQSDYFGKIRQIPH